MPPRRRGKKKLTEEELKQAFEDWKNAEEGEYEYLTNLKELAEELKLAEIDDLDRDLFQKTEPFLVEFQRMGAVFKVKKCRKFKKPVTQLAMRTAVFGGKLRLSSLIFPLYFLIFSFLLYS